VGFAGLKDAGRLGPLAGAPGTAAEPAHDVPRFELGIGAFTGDAEPGMSAVGVLDDVGEGLARQRPRGRVHKHLKPCAKAPYLISPNARLLTDQDVGSGTGAVARWL
jgi:hypothetical protein